MCLSGRTPAAGRMGVNNMQYNKNGNSRSWSSWRILLVLGLFVAVAAFGMLVSQQLLLDNARAMGKNLVTSYSTDEDRNLNEYERMVALGMAYLNDMATGNTSTAEIGRWTHDFFEKNSRQLNIDDAYVYAVVRGRLITSDGLSDQDVHQTSWYQQAIAASGKVIFTDLYYSDIRSQKVLTIASADPETDCAIAIDLPADHFQQHHNKQDLPVGGAYYVCDNMGNLLYYNVPFESTEEVLRDYTKDLFDRVNRGELDGKNNEIIGVQKVTRGLYYQHAENGWLCILTVPYDTLLQGVQEILVWYGAGLVLFLIAAVAMWLRDRRLSRTAQRNAETVQVLGNMYYALYRINVDTGTYEMTKSSDFSRQALPCQQGDYNDLLKVIISSLGDWTEEDFVNNFSLENIRKLVKDQVRDFGGEFLRQYGDEQRWISVRLLTDPEQIPNEAVLCFRDVEAEKEQQQQQVRLLKGALAAAEQSERSQKQFFSVMSHDMRTPLNIIIGMTSLALQPDCDREKMEGYLNKIGAASQQLLALINDILEISRLEQGNVSMEIKPFDLCQVLETNVSPFQTQAKNQGKEFSLAIDVKDRMIKGDPTRLGQVINNLVSNAMKFTREGDQVSVSLRQMDEGKRNNYLFVVEDTGTGMSEEFLPKLFDPYEREVRFGAREVMGTGLGMPIVKNLVTRMGGQIAVSSQLGKGTTFSVTIPFDVGEMPLPVQEHPPRQLAQLDGRQILLAEDNFLNMEIATELLKMRGAEVVPAEDGRKALEAFQNSPHFFFDAILMDMQMPEMDGCESTRAIRALDRPDAKTTPIIALTANAFAEDITRTTQAGMDAHLAKPINIEQLCAALTKLMSQRAGAQDELPTEGE